MNEMSIFLDTVINWCGQLALLCGQYWFFAVPILLIFVGLVLRFLVGLYKSYNPLRKGD